MKEGARERPSREPVSSIHGKELMASHTLPARQPPPRTIKPLLAAMMLVGTAAGGFFYSGPFIAAPLSAWVTAPTGDAIGQVKDQNGTIIPNATVAAADRATVTDGTGNFTLKDIPVGRQVIVVQAAGYKQERWVTLIAGGERQFSFRLEPGEGTRVEGDLSEQVNGFYTCGGIWMVFSALALLGGLFAAQRKRYPIAATGSLLGLGIYPLIPLGTILCIGAFVLLLFSRSEFQ